MNNVAAYIKSRSVEVGTYKNPGDVPEEEEKNPQQDRTGEREDERRHSEGRGLQWGGAVSTVAAFRKRGTMMFGNSACGKSNWGGFSGLKKNRKMLKEGGRGRSLLGRWRQRE